MSLLKAPSLPPSLPMAAANSRTADVIIGAGTIAAILLLVMVAWIGLSSTQHLRLGDTLSARVHDEQFAVETLLSTLKDAETGQRGYLLTGDAAYLAPYLAAQTRLDRDLAHLQAAPLRDQARDARVARIRALAARKLAVMGRTVRMRQAGDAAGALALVRTNEGLHLMDALRGEVDALQADAAAKLAPRLAGARFIWPSGEMVVLSALACALLGGVAALQRRARVRAVMGVRQLQQLTRGFGLSQGMMRELSGEITLWGAGSERLYGYTAEESLGRISHELLCTQFPAPLADIEAVLLRTGQWAGELRHRRRDGEPVFVASHWALHRGEAGAGDVVIEVNNDVTALKLAEQDRHRANALLAGVINAAPQSIYAKDRAGRMVIANQPLLDLVGKPWAEVEGRSDREFLPDPSQATVVAANDERVMTGGTTQEVEETVRDARGQLLVYLSTKAPMRDQDGDVVGLVGVSVDITERKRIELRLRLMVDELNHRVKNTLATVQAIALQTLRGGDPLMRQALEGRLMALAQVHDVLTREAWEAACLCDVLTEMLAPYGGMSDARFKMVGPDMRLSPKAALALALATHELATNAVKYGALALPNGHVDIHWRVTQTLPQKLHLTWVERGGPPVVAPTRRSFGTRLIEAVLPQDFGGTAHIDFTNPEGISCVIEADLSDITPTAIVFPMLGAQHNEEPAS